MNDTTNYMEYKLFGDTHIYIKKNIEPNEYEKPKVKNAQPKKIKNLETILSSITSKVISSQKSSNETQAKTSSEETSPLFKIFEKAPPILKSPLPKKDKRISIKTPNNNKSEENVIEISKRPIIKQEKELEGNDEEFQKADEYFCEKCLHGFNNLNLFTEHMKMHNDEEEMIKTEPESKDESFSEEACSITHFLSPDIDILEAPKTMDYYCEKCFRVFTDLSVFNEHMKLHTQKKSFECEECHKKFTLKNNLKKHIRIVHKKERHFKCETCSKTFGLKFDLQKHMRTHTGEKPFTCPHCLSKFGRKEVLVSHIRTHTGEKPFSCDQCSSKFTQKISLVRHLRIHSGPFICPQCPLRFSQKKTLINHLNMHSFDQMYVFRQSDS